MSLRGWVKTLPTPFGSYVRISAMDDASIPELQRAIQATHGCTSTWVESVSVIETFKGQIVWEGEVQVFELKGHPEASKCYVWSYLTDEGKQRFVAVVGVGPVISAKTAVKAYVTSTFRKPKSINS
jgi:hypothetical protein